MIGGRKKCNFTERGNQMMRALNEMKLWEWG
jgi:hypothetical protein